MYELMNRAGLVFSALNASMKLGLPHITCIFGFLPPKDSVNIWTRFEEMDCRPDTSARLSRLSVVEFLYRPATRVSRPPVASDWAAQIPIGIQREIGQRKGINKCQQAPDKLTLDRKLTLKHMVSSGTAFLVAIPEARLGADQSFVYLVTNRHVAEPGIEDEKVRQVFNYRLLVNEKGVSESEGPHLHVENLGPNVQWTYSDDPSVDLAVASANPPHNADVMSIPISDFISQDSVNQRQVVEADPVFLAGLFLQYAGIAVQNRLIALRA